ncbi:hypothetical protein V1264_011769 [Littorina saxatilis]
MGGGTLLIRHLPSSLSKEEKEDFLRHFGAVRVRVMGNKGPLKHTAFAEFSTKDIAAQVVGKLHQVEVLGCRLVVEFARGPDGQHLPPVTNSQPDAVKQEAKEGNKKEEEKKDEQEDNAFDLSFHQWGLKYPRRRRLHYLYPPPSPSILANISNALAACPRFYVQVLHLMNKMDLPAPFGPVTAQAPLAPDAEVTVNFEDKLQPEEMEVSSTEESELESDTDVNRPKEEAARKRKKPDSERQIRKRARLAMAMFQAPPPAPDTRPSASAVSLGEVFEQAGEGGGQRRIQLKLPGAVADSVTSEAEEISGPLLPPTLLRETERSGSQREEAAGETIEAGAQSTGFGLITPVAKPAEESENDEREEGWSETKFISKSELRKGRLSHREMEDHSIFRNYKEGEPSRRLYIKNLTKQVTEEDLHWIYGRYINWENEAEKNMFDIRLMKEGRMKGQAFVTLGKEEQAIKAVRDTNAFVLRGKPMAVLFARSAKQQEEGKS